MKLQGAGALLVSDLAEVAWTLNTRSRDVNCNPVAYAFLYLAPEGNTLFIKEEKITPEVADALAAANVSVAPYDTVIPFPVIASGNGYGALRGRPSGRPAGRRPW